ncbi:MAG: acetate--CoA ligase, partial [Pseudomonadota bacterium]
VVGYPHDIKGTGIFAFVVVKDSARSEVGDELVGALRQQVRHSIGAIAQPDRIVFVAGLPKTRSGKIMRRLLRKVASGDTAQLGDISTLADPSVMADIVKVVERSTKKH